MARAEYLVVLAAVSVWADAALEPSRIQWRPRTHQLAQQRALISRNPPNVIPVGRISSERGEDGRLRPTCLDGYAVGQVSTDGDRTVIGKCRGHGRGDGFHGIDTLRLGCGSVREHGDGPPGAIWTFDIAGAADPPGIDARERPTCLLYTSDAADD